MLREYHCPGGRAPAKCGKPDCSAITSYLDACTPHYVVSHFYLRFLQLGVSCVPHTQATTEDR